MIMIPNTCIIVKWVLYQ